MCLVTEITDRPDNIKTEQEEARVKEEFERKVELSSIINVVMH